MTRKYSSNSLQQNEVNMRPQARIINYYYYFYYFYYVIVIVIIIIIYVYLW
jgi:hypothetical protein